VTFASTAAAATGVLEALKAQGREHTRSAAYPLDLYDKIKKAISLEGVTYIHIHTPCPPGWGFETRYTVKIGELAVETGYWDLYEAETGEFRLTGASARTLKKGVRRPVMEYLQKWSTYSG